MADMNNFGDIQESFIYITEALDSIRAQNAMNLGNMDKVLANINNQLDELTKEDGSDLMKVFFVELKRSLDERHDFVSSKFAEMESSFRNITQKAEKQLTGSEVKELFEIIANNLNVFSKDFSSQKQLISEIGLKIEDLQNDESQKKEILKNISVLKLEMEKFGNGFESIIVNLNDNFGNLSQVLQKLDSSTVLDGIKKDIENIFLSSNAILSTQQVIDHKNRELEATINTFVTKDDFNVEREQVAKLIAQNIELTNYINNLPTHNQFESLTEKIDTSIGVINALKNMLTETGKQNQKLLTAQLENLETKILNISSEEEFIGFRKELSEFAKQVMDNTNLIRADLADTNSAVKSLYEFLNTIDIKNSFLNFTQITKNSENNIKDSVSTLSKNVMEETVKNRNLTRSDVENGVSQIASDIEKAKNELNENSKGNLSSIIEHIQSVVNNIFSVKNALHIENSENLEVMDDKLQVIKEEVVNTSNFVVQNAQENLENVLSNIEKIYQEMSTVKGTLDLSFSENTQNLGAGFQEIATKIEDTRNDINNHSREGFAYIRSLIDDFSAKISSIQEDIETDALESSTEIKEIIGGLSLKLNSLQEQMTTGYDVNFTEIKNLIEELTQITQSAKASLEQNSKYEILGLKTNIEDLSQKLSVVEENLDIRGQSNVAQIGALFVELTKDFSNYKEFLSEATQSNFESVSLCVQNLNQKIEDSKTLFNDELKSSFSQIQGTIESLPEVIKENQVIFENEKKTLIEENSRNIQEINEKIQNLIKGILAKDNPFKEEVLFEFSGLKSSLEIFKEELLRSGQEVDDNLTNQIAEFVEGVEKLIGQYDEKTNSVLISLQSSLGDNFDSVKQITLQSNSKLDNSLREASEIKSEIRNVIEKLSEIKENTEVSELAYNIGQRFDGILVDITQLEEKIAVENSDSLQNVLDNISEKFETASYELREYKSYTSGQTNEIIEDLTEKTDMIKSQLNLLSADIINIVSARTTEIITKLASIADDVNQISEINFEGAFVDIKNRLETGYFTITSVIKQDIERLNEGQLEKLSEDFDNIYERLDKILYRVSSDNTKEIVELKSILTERVDNIASINSVLEVVLNRLESINTAATSNKDDIYNIKSELVERLNLFENSLLASQEESQSEFFGKIADFQNRKTASIFDKIDEAQIIAQAELVTKIADIQSNETDSVLNKIDESKDESQRALYEIKENINDATQEFYSSTQEIFSGVKNDLVEKITAFEDTVLQTHYSTRTAVLDRMSEIQNNTKEELLSGVKENITSTVEELYASTQDVFSEVKIDLIKKINTLEEALLTSQSENNENVLEKLSDSQDRTRNELLYGIKENFSTVTDDLHASTQAILSGVKSDLLSKINELEDTLTQAQDGSHDAIIEKLEESNVSTKTSILNKIDDIHEEISAMKDSTGSNLLYGIKENITSSIDDFYSSAQELFAGVKGDLIDKISSLKETLIDSQQGSKVTILDRIDEAKYETKEAILDKISDIQYEISDSQEKNKNDILYGVKENLAIATDDFCTSAQEAFAETKGDILDKVSSLEENLVNSQDSFKISVLDKIVEINEESKTEIIENINQLPEEIQTVISDKIIEVSDDVKIEIIDNIYKNQEDLKTTVSEKVSEINEKSKKEIINSINQLPEEIQTVISDKIVEVSDEAKAEIIENISQIQEEVKETVSDRLVELNDEAKAEVIDNILQSQEDLKKTIAKEVSKSQTKTEAAILSELEENIKTVKELLESYKSDEKISKEDSEKVDELDAVIQNVAQSIEDKIEASEENYKTSTQSLLSDIKISFYEKVDDSLDGLKSFMELFEQDKGNQVPQLLENLKADVLDKFLEMTDSIEDSISSVSVKKELEDLNREIDNSIDTLFDKIKEEFSSSIENSETIKGIADKSSVVEEKIENLKETILEDLSDKFAKFEVEVANQKTELSTMKEELQTSLAELKENYIDLSLNSSMEISDLLVNFQEKIDNIQNKLNEFNPSDNTFDIKGELDSFDFNNAISQSKNEINEKIEAITQKLDSLAPGSESIPDESIKEVKEELETINQKLDSLVIDSASDSDSEISLGSSSEIEANIREIKEILSSQGNLVEKLEGLGNADTLQGLGDLSEVKTEIQNVIKNFENKLETLIQESGVVEGNVSDTSNINQQLNSFKEELIEGLVEFFNQISFAAESEDIKDFVSQKTNEIRSEINSKLGIQNEIKDIKRHLLSLQTSLEEGSDYSYTLQDVESDIAKLRLVLKDIAENRSVSSSSSADLSGLDKLSEDITSISTRTNKLLLNSDESYATLKHNLEDLRGIIYQFETKVKYLDNKEPINKIERKLDNLNNLVLSCVQSDKIFNQTFMYLAEWIDKADSNIDSIKQNMVKTTDIEKLLDKFSKKFDKQEEKIKSLEAKIEKLTKTKPSKETDIKTLVKEVLSKVEMSEFRPDAKLAKKVDGIDKQLVTLGKNIEKITSYVD